MMASFACIAYALERAADIMLGDLALDADKALTRAIWGARPVACDDCGERDRHAVAARVVELQYSRTIVSDVITYLSDIPKGSARTAAREVAQAFRLAGGRAHLDGDDPHEVARLMWEQAHSVELVKCP